ncbi:hypothetical protein M9H77_28283 [Catharanthus roseus]|uniref:Uncharacterized protein n=1 Tax=Catharanthus roseus TaxID=4058 RepID=A0ACC0AGK5_CATRO|nr:hypothetical protein M9H77_28283 [Catharanthus roseus]
MVRTTIVETHPLIARNPNEIFHSWSLSARASEALSHQSFAIPRSRKAANVTLIALSYLRNFGVRNFRNRSNASSTPMSGTHPFLLVAIEASNNSIISIIRSLIILCIACSGRGGLPYGFRLYVLRTFRYGLIHMIRRS